MYFKDIISGLINYVRIQVNNRICILLAYNMLSFSTSFSGHPGRCNRLNISDRTRSYPSSHSSCPILLWRKTLPYNQRMFCIPPEFQVPQPIHRLRSCFISLRLFTQASKLLYLKIRRMLHFSLTLCPQFKFFFKPYSFRYKLDSDVLIFVTWCYDWKPWLLNQFRVENWEVSICHLWQFHVCPQSCWAVKDDTWISIDCLISIKNMCRVYKFLWNSIRGEIE